MNTVLKSTEYAKDLAIRANGYPHGRQLTNEERSTREALPERFRQAQESIEAGSAEAWRNLYNEFLPIWVNEVDHEGNRNLLHWGGSLLDDIFRSRGGRDLFTNFNNFLVATRGIPTETVDIWISRIDSALSRYRQSTFFTYEGFYTSTFPLEDLDYFVGNSRYYEAHVIAAFNKGYTPAIVRKTHYTVWTICSAAYVEEFVKLRKPAILSSLTQLGSRGSTVLTEAIVNDLADAGFEKMSEVKDYARKFGIGWTDSDFFSRAVAAKRKYPNLAEYKPEV